MSQRLQSPAGAARPDRAAAAGAEWDCFVSSHPNAHFLQTSAWAALKERFGWQARRVTIPDAKTGALQAGAMVLLRRAAGLTVAYVPRGPVVEWGRPALVADTLAAVEEESRRAGAAVLRLEPELADTPQHRALLRQFGYVPSPQTVQPPSTIVLPLDGDEETVLGRMKSKWRYNIRLAERKGVTVRPLARDELPVFHELMAETGRRDGFALHTPDYYTAAYDLLTPEMGVFLLAGYQDQPLAAIVVLACGPVAWYVWGASSSRERQRMPNHALQWAGMRWARARGAVRYDLWGIPDAIGQVALGLNRGDGSGAPVEAIPVDLDALSGEELWGVYRFKQGFGGQVVRHVGAWDKPLHPVGYRLFQVGLALQRTERRLMQSWGEPAMGGLAVTEVYTAAEWRAALAALPDAHVLQSWEWGEVKAQTGWRAERAVLREPSGRAKAAYQLLTRRLASGLPLGIGYVPKGPALDWTNSRLVETVLAQIERHARRQGCIFVKIDPDVEEYAPEGIRLRQLLRLRGWRFSADQIQFKNSAITDLRGDEATLLEGMKSKWRYNIRLAERRGIHVRRGGEADLPTFYALYQETARRDGFLIRPFDYYRTTWTTFLRAGAEPANPAGGALLLAEHEEEPVPLAGLFLLRYGPRAWYFYGASSDRRRRDMPNYLLQWEALRWARAYGCTVYDWWGAPTRLDDPDDGLQGVWQFKQGFGARFVARVGAWDYPVYPGLYRLYTEAMPRLLGLLRRAQAPLDESAPAG
ncbi:MAG TPA: peptidoglycan bridge formation glycyltransferase FemA/FemB family protein [Caldilineaceae bacterium]|nr:peptidoglycan bridge formation glycyltransferase FemA/FemB family protein [Caldilineaceae bacterium]